VSWSFPEQWSSGETTHAANAIPPRSQRGIVDVTYVAPVSWMVVPSTIMTKEGSHLAPRPVGRAMTIEAR
jgi:hypothetical protein